MMTRTETVAKCILWYIGALLLAPLPFLASGEWQSVMWCEAGLPAMLGLIFLMREAVVHVAIAEHSLPEMLGLLLLHGCRPNPIPILVIGYLVQIGLAVGAIYAEQSTRHRCYLIFICLLVLDVCVAWFGPILFLLIVGGPGE